jgi:nucleotide-binding universal stress UspA family protein
MYRRILVPIDGSSTSTLGVEHALKLAKDQDAVVRVLNVLDDTYMLPVVDAYPVADMSFLLDSVKATGEDALSRALALAQRHRVKAERAMVESRGRRVSDVILDQARRWRADVIVMGTHGRRGLNRLLLGSDAERVLHETKVPVLLVRADPSKKPGTPKRAAKPRARKAAGAARK